MSDNETMLVCKQGFCSFRLWASQVPTFPHFISKVTDKLSLSEDVSCGYTYQLNDGQDCSLNYQADFKNMILLGQVMKLDVISIGIPSTQPVGTVGERDIDLNKMADFDDNIVEVQPCSYNTFATPVPHEPLTPLHNAQLYSSPPIVSPPNKAIKRFSFNDRVIIDVGGPTSPNTPKKSKRKASLPEYLFDDTFSPHKPDMGSPIKKPKSRRRLLQEKHDRGDFYPGCNNTVPIFDFNPEHEVPVLRSDNWITYIVGVGQEFRGGVVEFRDKLVKYSAKRGFQYKYSKNDATYVKAFCARLEAEDCKWHVRGSVSSVTKAFTIKEADLRHTCKLALLRYDSKRLGQRTIASIIVDLIRAHPTLTAIVLQRDILAHWGFVIKYEKVWRSVEAARATVFGNYHDSFDELRWYSEALKKTNPGSITALETEGEENDNRFKRFFVAFDASLHGFKSCRPMLFVDGTFMKSRYKGTLLGATAKDGNNGLFPVAMAIVSTENAENWTWFLQMLRKYVHHEEEIMYVSDRAGGLMTAFDVVYEKRPVHYFCLYHLMKNLRAMYAGKKFSEIFKNHMCKLLKDAAYAPTMYHFHIAIKAFKDKGGDTAIHFLKDLPFSKWAVAFSPHVHRYGDLTSNSAESFNSWILDARSLPVTFMLDCIRSQLMRWFYERRQDYSKWTGALTPTMEEIWDKSVRVGANWIIAPTLNHAVFEVLSGPTCVVDLPNRCCSCYQWQISGFPCVHAVACINQAKWDVRLAVESYFFASNYKAVYAANLNPIPTTEKFEFIDLNQPMKINPPVMRRAPGRPKDKRHRSRGERKPDRFLCGRCGKYGTHYWTTCAEAMEDSAEDTSEDEKVE